MMKKLLASIGCLFAGTVCAAGPGAASGVGAVYIAGEDFSLEQALSEARTENPRVGRQPFSIVVKGYELPKLRRSEASSDLVLQLRQIQNAGGVLYVCTNDLAAAHLTSDDLVPGVRVVRGWNAAESGLAEPADAQTSAAAEAPLPPLRNISRLCAPDAPAADPDSDAADNVNNDATAQ